MAYRFVKTKRGKKRTRMEVDSDGYVTVGFLQRKQNARSARSRAMDSRMTSKVLIPMKCRPEEALQWIRNPSECDIIGIDAPIQIVDGVPTVYRQNRAIPVGRTSYGTTMITAYNSRPESPDVLHPAVKYMNDPHRYNLRFPNATTWQWCSNCESEVVIPAYRPSRCPVCGDRIIPCNMCEECMADCPYGN